MIGLISVLILLTITIIRANKGDRYAGIVPAIFAWIIVLIMIGVRLWG